MPDLDLIKQAEQRAHALPQGQSGNFEQVLERLQPKRVICC
jgi:hypothetical protein